MGHTTNSIPHSFKPSLRKLAVIFRPRIFSKGEMVVRPRSCQGGVLASGAEPRQAAQVSRRTRKSCRKLFVEQTNYEKLLHLSKFLIQHRGRKLKFNKSSNFYFRCYP